MFFFSDMKELLYPVILLCQYILISAEVKITITAKPNETDIQIKELEKTKEELLRKINGAIDDSVVALEKTNDSESAKGLHYLSELKKQIKEINSADTDIEVSDNVSLSAENMLNEFNITGRMKKFRRKGKKSSIVNEDDPQTRAKKYFEFQLPGKKRKMTTKEVPHDQKKVEKDIEEWLKQRHLEKMKIKNYKEQMRAQHKETCPNFGFGKKRKGMRSRSKSRQKKRKSYPCCRKCCKQSYLGCL